MPKENPEILLKAQKKYPQNRLSQAVLLSLQKKIVTQILLSPMQVKTNIFKLYKNGEDCITPIEAIDHYDEYDVTGITLIRFTVFMCCGSL